jgi:rhodanese-related sulfurtransferase
MSDAPDHIDVPTARDLLLDGQEIAFVDVREEGQHGSGHPLLAVNLPYSRLEAEIGAMVPRRDVRLLLIDDGDGVAQRAAARLGGIGYGNLFVLSGGAPAWADAGHALFESTNVPSKAFAEMVEHACGTPHIEAEELDALQRSGADVKILDSRTIEEFGRFHVPGAMSCPGAELVHRFADLVPSPDSFVVISCAGRTRGIIGAQALIDAGIPNRVAALAGGTQGWRLAGLELERQVPAVLAPVSDAAVVVARQRAAAVIDRFRISRIDHATLAAWRADAARTTHVLDVRTPAEYAAGHLPGAVSAQGGQLVQATDKWVGTRGARLVLVDDTGVRAAMTAHWLLQMGWDVHVLRDALAGVALEAGTPPPPADPQLAGVPRIGLPEAAQWLRGGAASIFVGSSAAYRLAHPAGAVWAIRPRLDRLPASVLTASRLVVFAEDAVAGGFAALDLAEAGNRAVALAVGDEDAWRAAGIAVAASGDVPDDADRIDFLFWTHDRHDGNFDAMRSYLSWETALPPRIVEDGTAGFRVAATQAPRARTG